MVSYKESSICYAKDCIPQIETRHLTRRVLKFIKITIITHVNTKLSWI